MSTPDKSNVVALPRKEATDKQVQEALDNSKRTKDKHQEEVRKAYDVYTSYGWRPVLLYPGRKRPIGNNWLEKPMPSRDDFVGFHNIGNANGEKSGVLDLDIDDRELIPALELLMPATGGKFGRFDGGDSLVLSHWLYRCSIDKSFVIKKPNGGTALEFRSNGGQTVFPPSFVYDNDLHALDLVCWAGGSKADIPALETIPELEFDTIKRAGILAAGMTYACEHFTSGSYHIDMLAWCGLLAKAGYSRQEARISVEFIVNKTGQTGLDDRLAGLEDTFDKYEQGEVVSGISTFRDSGWDEKFTNWLKNLFKVRSEIESDGRPQVRVVASKETKLFDDTLVAMVLTKKFYSMGGQIVIINRETQRVTHNGITAVNARVVPLSDSVAMGAWLTREIQFIQSTLDKAAMQYKDQLIKAPPSLASELANPHTFRGDLPPLNAVSNVPLITRTGRIIDEHWGYDEELAIFFACRHPYRRMHADEALETLRELFCDFPFALGGALEDPSTRLGVRYGRYLAAAISAVLSAVVRPAMDICPAYGWTSSMYSDGKSIGCATIAAVVGMEHGAANSPLTRGGSDEEQEKQLAAALAKGKRVMIFDNHDGEFRSPALTEMLTSTAPEFRVLGKSEVRSIPNRSLVLINGVNMVLAGDLQTRTVTIRMARTDLNPNRNFRHVDLVGWASENSERFVSAAISLIDWALKQEDGDWKPNHRFKIWDRLVRRTMMLAAGVDVAPPAVEDTDRVVDPLEEVKMEFLEWVINRWESGLRDSKYKSYIRGNNLAAEVAPESPQEGWIDTLSKRKFDPLDRKIGRCLTIVKDIPVEYKGEVFRVVQSGKDGRTVYRVEKI